MAKVWGYSSTHKRYIGMMKKKNFIKLVADRDRASVNWVNQRTSDTGNKKELELAFKNPNKILEVDD